MNLIEQIINDIILREGDYVDLSIDRGGPTRWGVTQAALAEWRGKDVTADDVKVLSQDEAKAIYRDRYVVRPHFAELPDPLRGLVVDCGVNHGTSRATQWLQRALRLTDDGIVGGETAAAMMHADPKELYRKVLAARVRFYGRIITDNPKQSAFAAGWANRAAGFVESCP